MSAQVRSDRIAALEECRRQAMLQADVDVLHGLLDESLVYVHSTGARDNRASYLDKLRQAQVRYEKLEFSLDKVQSTDRFAWVSGKMDARIRITDQILAVQSRYEAIWMNIKAKWVLLALQSYPGETHPGKS